MESAFDWSSLLPHVLVEIAIRVRLLEDFLAFKGVCTTWRAAATAGRAKFAAASKWVPLLLLAEKEDSDEREFYSILSSRKVIMRLPLPEAKGRKCIEVGFGWLLTVAFSGEVNLLNPLSRTQIEVPNFTSFPEYDKHKFYPNIASVQRAVLSGNPSDTSSNFVLFVVSSSLGLWTPGDKNWTRIEPYNYAFADITYYNQKLYALDYKGGVWVWDPTGNEAAAAAHLIFNVCRNVVSCRKTYLVESSDGELLLLTRDGFALDDLNNYEVTNFGIIRLDVVKREWEETTSLGRDAIFVGHSASISVPAPAFPDGVLKSNCIYFSDDYWEWFDCGDKAGIGTDTGIYNVEDQSIERFDIESLSFICPPLWISPGSSILKVEDETYPWIRKWTGAFFFWWF